ncbi:DUF4333 domain-containing protein [Streptomyces pathocidini]|uniref:DUF4333 domain-containing protein n=1 Tax=Streptomyces pathocidini TaxID=1650571 RepID=UPI0033D96B5F
MSDIRLSATALSTVAVSALLVGCSISGKVEKVEPKLSSDKLAATVADQLAATTGQPKPDVTCPDDLATEVGKSTRCKLTAGDDTAFGVSVTVSSVKGASMWISGCKGASSKSAVSWAWGWASAGSRCGYRG